MFLQDELEMDLGQFAWLLRSPVTDQVVGPHEQTCGQPLLVDDHGTGLVGVDHIALGQIVEVELHAGARFLSAGKFRQKRCI